jgi:hypothetical protein
VPAITENASIAAWVSAALVVGVDRRLLVIATLPPERASDWPPD